MTDTAGQTFFMVRIALQFHKRCVKNWFLACFALRGSCQLITRGTKYPFFFCYEFCLTTTQFNFTTGTNKTSWVPFPIFWFGVVGCPGIHFLFAIPNKLSFDVQIAMHASVVLHVIETGSTSNDMVVDFRWTSFFCIDLNVTIRTSKTSRMVFGLANFQHWTFNDQ